MGSEMCIRDRSRLFFLARKVMVTSLYGAGSAGDIKFSVVSLNRAFLLRIGRMLLMY